MLFKDLDIFLRAAAAILQGSDPYSIPNLEVFYPLPFYFLFIPFVVIPAPAVYAVWFALSVIVLVAILRQRAVFVVLSMPVLLTFLLGQIDIVIMGLYAAIRSGVGAGIALAFIVLKPQLALLLAPWMLWYWWRSARQQIVSFALVIGSLVVASFVVQPDWVARFLARSGERTRAAISSSIWGLTSFMPSSLWLPLTALIVAAIVIWALRKNSFPIVATVGLLTSPFIFSYNLTPLFITLRRKSLLIGLTVLSWITFGIGAWQSSDNAAVFITLVILGTLILEKQR